MQDKQSLVVRNPSRRPVSVTLRSFPTCRNLRIRLPEDSFVDNSEYEVLIMSSTTPCTFIFIVHIHMIVVRLNFL